MITLNEITKAQIARTERSLSNMAGEPVTVEFCPDWFYGFCQSELGAYRVGYQHRGVNARVAYSENRKCWYVNIPYGSIHQKAKAGAQ